MSIEQYEAFYFDAVEPTLTSAHVFSIKGTWDIICFYLNEKAKVEELITSGTKKYQRPIKERPVIICHHKYKREFLSEKDAKEWTRLFLDKYSKTPDILFSSL